MQYDAEPTPARLHNDRGLDVQYIEGPVGSGKSTACMMEILMRAIRQQPDDQGYRKSRWAIVRNTYPELKTTTIKTWQQWVPNAIAPIVYSMPINCTFKQKMADGTVVELEVYFMALDTPDDVSKLLSLELTGAYINEAREIPFEIIEGLISRIDRYPKTLKDSEGKRLYGATEPGVICDSNPPRTTHWCYLKFETGETPRGWRKYKQPAAVYWDGERWLLNPDAENLTNLSADYYDRQLALGDEHIRVNLAGEYGMTRKGKPVFSKFSEMKHVAKEILLPMRGTPVLIGIDYGLTPGVIIGQLNFKGLVLLDELPATDESLEDFLDQYVLPLIRTKYNGYKIIACGDPAGMGRSAQTKITSFQIMNSRGITAYPAATNVFAKRKEAVDFFLGRDEGFVLSPHLLHTREALGAGYVYKETRNSSGRVLDIPDKNEYSHIADAVQYLCMYARYGAGKPVNKPVGDNEVKPQAKPFLWA
jgi:hypothetical protein